MSTDITTMIITRQQYLNSKDPDIHQKYYSQFVTDEIKNLVKNKFGIRKLVNAYTVDPNFNNIPLKKWDSLLIYQGYINTALLKEVGDYLSLSNVVCICKAAFGRRLLSKSILTQNAPCKKILTQNAP